MKIMPNILHHVGNTPLVRLNRIGKDEGIKCDLRKYLAHLDVLELQNFVVFQLSNVSSSMPAEASRTVSASALWKMLKSGDF